MTAPKPQITTTVRHTGRRWTWEVHQLVDYGDRKTEQEARDHAAACVRAMEGR